ncbi:PREDICTED: serologically defined colon cancer antigen 8 homolog isoform X2 [Nicrophorus vespilloides]|uniref:Serologically defined colon cancer antigen 8 homolog isoform X2 n=1 Tax=Nicrophorus vespilloides TaxID=110193 RepID=A0ABM1M6L1_NICVS|nr:PREDICTED: serologically defined colon cancer antigen 8 homolog isoform X2 [Nicrophorus vespilloides]
MYYNTRKPFTPKLEYRKKPDYADTAYKEAVSRLRILLAETYTPVKRTMRDFDSAGDETDNQSIISGVSRISKYPPFTSTSKKYPYYTPRTTTTHITNIEKHEIPNKFESQIIPPELSTFMERQEDYIEQLEKESRFCKDELSTLLSKVKDIIFENDSLHEKQKSSLMKSVFDQFETETETETEAEMSKLKSPKKSRKQKVLEGPSIVFESRISELEAQLTQIRIELKKSQEENDTLRKKVSDCDYGEGAGINKNLMDNLTREKNVLQETVSKLQSALNLLRDKEQNTSDQVKRSLDVAEQAQYEKTAAEHEIRRLKDELERQHSKLRESINDQNRRIADERSAVERRYTQQIEQLTSELGVHWEQNGKLQLELDKQRRESTDSRRELAQKQALIDELKKEMQNKIITLQSDIGVSGAEKSALEQQISSLQMANERNERQSKQEVARMQVEMQSLRQRLDRADADSIHSKRENIRLTELIAALEKEINMNAALSDERSKRSEAIALPSVKEEKEKDMGLMIKNIENKHAATVAELEGMIQSQNQLMDKLSSDCHVLTQKLEESSNKHKEEIRELQTNLDYLSNKFSQSQIKSPDNQDEINGISKVAPHATPKNIKETAPKNNVESAEQQQQNHESKEDAKPEGNEDEVNYYNNPEEMQYAPNQEDYQSNPAEVYGDQQEAYPAEQYDPNLQENYSAEQYVPGGQDPNLESYPAEQYDQEQYSGEQYEQDPNYPAEQYDANYSEEQYDQTQYDPNQGYSEQADPNAEVAYQETTQQEELK